MFRRILFFIAFVITGWCSPTYAQNNCSNAVQLCANSIVPSTTQSATAGPGETLSCGDGVVTNNVWFTLTAISNGSTTVSVTNIGNNPGLEMEIFTGNCGALTTTGNCTTGSSVTGGAMSITFNTTANTTYYIMVDGASGNQEAFSIEATSVNNAIVGRPSANFNTNPSYGCLPLNVQLDNTSILLGGTNVTYEWTIDNGGSIPSSGADTNIVFTTPGTHTVTLRVCNTECGCKTVSQDIIVQELLANISFSPNQSCVGSTVSFTGSAEVLPDPPYSDPNVTSWTWNFGDPNSGANNTASGQSVSHSFTGPQTFYQITLIAAGVCGTDTTTTFIDLNPQPLLTSTAAQVICEGQSATVSVTAVGGNPGYSYSWNGSGTISCVTCSSTTVSGLSPGTTYPYTVTVTDAFGCTSTATSLVTVNPRPVVSTTPTITACYNSTVSLSASVSSGSGPFTYSWLPSAGLSNSNAPNPTLTATSSRSYCVTVTDAAGCSSSAACTNVTVRPRPTVSPGIPSLCVTDPTTSNTFTVSGAGAGSTYSWYASPSYSTISGANSDSSTVNVNFLQGVATTYNYAVIVNDGITGCRDTITTSFTIQNNSNLTINGTAVICQGNAATITANNYTQYSWSATPAYTFTDSTAAQQVVSPTTTTLFTVIGISGSCVDTNIFILTVNQRPNITVTPVTPFCGCSNIQLSASSTTANASFSWSGLTSIVNPGAASTGAFACESDSIRLRVTSPAGCIRDTVFLAPSRPAPAAVAAVSPGLICAGSAAVVSLDGSGSTSGSGTTYLWTSSNPAVVINDTTALTTSATVGSTTIFYLTVRDAFGCDSTVSDTVSIQAPPIISASNLLLCANSPSATSTISISGANAGSTYVWTQLPSCVTPQNPTNATATFDFSSCGTGIYDFGVTVNDPVNSCTTALTQQVVVTNGINLTTSADTTVCGGGSLVLSASGATSYIWSTGSTDDSITVTGLTSAGSPYDFIVTGTSGSCTAIDTITVIVQATPVTGPISGTDTVCQNQTNVIYTVSPANGNYQWTVNGGSLQSGQGTSSVAVIWGNSGNGSISVIDSAANSCIGNTQLLNVFISPAPVAPVVTGNANPCANSTLNYNVFATPGSTFNWSVSGGTIIGSNQNPTVTVQWSAAGNGTVSVFETNAAGCQGPAYVYLISVNPIPVPPTVNGDSLVCQGSSILYTINPPTAGTFYTWQPTGGIITANNQGFDSVTVTWPNSGNYQLSLTATNLGNCSSTPTLINVTVNPRPFVNAIQDSVTACSGAAILLTASAPFGTVAWSTSGSGTFSDPSIISPTYLTGNTDTGTITLTVISAAIGCPDDSDLVLVNIVPLPAANATASADSVCQGTAATLTATGGGTYLWTPGGATDSVITVTPAATTEYTVQVTNTAGCTATAPVTVTVIPAGIPDAGDDIIACYGDSVSLSGSQQNATGLVWSTSGDGNFLPGTTSNNTSYIPGVNDTTDGFNFIYLTTTGACLNVQDTLLINYAFPPTVNAGPDTLLSAAFTSGISIQLTPTITNAGGVVWSTSGNGFFYPSDTSLFASYEPSEADFESDSIVLTLTIVGGCEQASDELVIEFSPFVIPNVFTPYPASPGKNDYFVINNLPNNSVLKIWDRWGVLVFESQDYQNNWDAANLNSDTYYYVLVSRGRDFHGWVHVIREEK